MGRFIFRGQIWLGMNNSESVHFRVVNTGQERGGQVRTVPFASVAFFLLICTVYEYYVAKMSKIAFTRFGGQIRLPKCNGGQVR